MARRLMPLVLVGSFLLGLGFPIYAHITSLQRKVGVLEELLVAGEEHSRQLASRLSDTEFRLYITSFIASYRPPVSATELATEVLELAKAWGGSDYRALALHVAAIGAVETHWQPHRRGRLGEIGPLQVRPTTAADLGFKATELVDWRKALAAGVEYLVGICLERASGDRALASAYYNAGPYQDKEQALHRARDYMTSVELIRVGLEDGWSSLVASL